MLFLKHNQDHWFVLSEVVLHKASYTQHEQKYQLSAFLSGATLLLTAMAFKCSAGQTMALTYGYPSLFSLCVQRKKWPHNHTPLKVVTRQQISGLRYEWWITETPSSRQVIRKLYYPSTEIKGLLHRGDENVSDMGTMKNGGYIEKILRDKGRMERWSIWLYERRDTVFLTGDHRAFKPVCLSNSTAQRHFQTHRESNAKWI